MRFPQRITFVGSIIVETDGLDLKRATEVVKDELMEAGHLNLEIIRVTKLELVEED